MQSFAEKMRRSIASQQAGRCCCRQCVEDRGEMRFCGATCPVCGERSCPKLADHRQACPRQAQAETGQAAAAQNLAALPGEAAGPSSAPS